MADVGTWFRRCYFSHLVSEKSREIVEPERVVRMVCPQGVFRDRQGKAAKRFRLLVLPLG